jgi:hypothetical protein
MAPARAFRALDLLIRRHHQPLIARLAIVAAVFVDRVQFFMLVRTKATASGEPGAVGQSQEAESRLVAGNLLGHRGLRGAVAIAVSVADFIRIADGHGSGAGRGPFDVRK